MRNVKSLASSIEELENTFIENSGDLLALDTKDIMPAEVAESVQNIKKIGQSQYNAFVTERVVEGRKPITHPIKRNKLPLFSRPTTKTVSKKQAQVSALKDDCSSFSRPYISCQAREGDSEEFLCMKNSCGLHHCPSMVNSGKVTNRNLFDVCKVQQKFLQGAHR